MRALIPFIVLISIACVLGGCIIIEQPNGCIDDNYCSVNEQARGNCKDCLVKNPTDCIPGEPCPHDPPIVAFGPLCMQKAETDGGSNSVLRGQVNETIKEISGELNLTAKIIATDVCLNSTTLLEFFCSYSSADQSHHLENVTVDCPYGCESGACKLGSAATFCIPNGPCATINETMSCYNTMNSERALRKVGFTDPTSERQHIIASVFGNCINNASRISFSCTRFTPIDDYRGFLKVELGEESCPSGYVCDAGHCVEPVRSTAGVGDLDADGAIIDKDLGLLKSMLEKTPVQYSALADMDADGYLDWYDYSILDDKLHPKVEQQYGVREFFISSPLKIMTFNKSIDVSGLLIENANGQTIRTWSMETEHKGNSRMDCYPPVFSLNLKNVNKNTRIDGISTFGGFSTLKYDELKFIPDCELWTQADTNLLREFFVYRLFRVFGMPVVDVVGFANVTFQTADPIDLLNKTHTFQYMLLQRYESDKDQITFMEQYNLSKIFTTSNISIASMNRAGYFEIYEPDIPNSQAVKMSLDIDVAIKYDILSNLVRLVDRGGSFQNEDYGIVNDTGVVKYISYDHDYSFVCGRTGEARIFEDIQFLDPAQKATFEKRYYEIAREIFDNPQNLNLMLKIIDKYPFQSTKIRNKNFVKEMFYLYALNYSSEAFAAQLHQQFVPFKNRALYIQEARRLVATSHDSVCGSEMLAEELRKITSSS